MRHTQSGAQLSVRAVAGTQVVLLAWDVRDYDTSSLLGFAVERTEHREGAPYARQWLRGIKRFVDKDRGLPPGTPVPTSEHPIQTFQWGDYTADPDTHYEYRVVPCTGTPRLMALDEARAVTVPVDTEREHDGHRQEVYFNRGVAGSQAYAREFAHAKPDVSDPGSKQMRWLSSGLYEALTAFVAQARGPRHALRAALYEFRYGPAGQLFKDAVTRGADVRILYDEPSFGAENEAMIDLLGLSRCCAPRVLGGAQKHNKFIVLLEDGRPVAVWTGSTNLSAGGIFGHSNVGHVVREPAVAQAYLDAWSALCNALEPAPTGDRPFRDTRTDPERGKLAKRNEAAGPTPKGVPPPPGTTALFSPRGAATLPWYAELLASAREIACLTLAFTLADDFVPFLEKDSDVLRFILSDKQLKQGELIQRDRDVLYAAGAKFEQGSLGEFLSEELTGLNSNRYIHDKFMLVDPLGLDPVVVTGSANFSHASQVSNDENMLVIRGDQRVADIYFGEFMRLFDHLYARYLAKLLRAKGGGGATQDGKGWLAPDARWVKAHVGEGPKSRRRRYFHGPWNG